MRLGVFSRAGFCGALFLMLSPLLLGKYSALAATLVRVPVATPEPKIEAAAWALMELNSGWIVASQNASERRAPASITKLMANYVLFSELNAGNISLQDEVLISEAAWRAIGSRSFAEVGSKVPLEVLLKGMVVQSGNDASIALAEHVAGTEVDFAGLMNQYARQIGLQNSFFVNATGLTADNHEMTSIDILKLSAALIEDFPQYYSWFSQKEFTHNGIRQRNRNGLLWKDESVDGLKTGYTDAAGYCLVASAKKNDQRWIAVVLGTDSAKAREEAVFSLLKFGFNNFEPATFLSEQASVGDIEVYSGDIDLVQVKVAGQADIVVPQGRAQDVQISYEYPDYLLAPIAASSTVGQVRLMLDGVELYKAPLLSVSEVKEAGFFGRLIDAARLKWRHFFSD